MRFFRVSQFFFMLAMLVLSSVLVFAAASVSRDMPSRVSPGEAFTVTFNVANADVGKVFTLEDDLPDGWSFVDWEVSGSKEDKAVLNHRIVEGNRHGWSFTVAQPSVQVKYSVKASSSEGSFVFDAVWFDASGQSRDKRAVVVRTISCGDGVCEGSENSDSCVADCPKPVQTSQPPVSQPSGPAESKPVEQPKPNLLIVLIILALVVGIGVEVFVLLRKRKK